MESKRKTLCVLLISMILIVSHAGCDSSGSDGSGDDDNLTEIEIVTWNSSLYDADIDNASYDRLKGTWKLVSRKSAVFDVEEKPKTQELIVFREDKAIANYTGDDMQMTHVSGIKKLTSSEITRFWCVFPRVLTNCWTDIYELSNSDNTLKLITKNGSDICYEILYEKSDKNPVSAFVAQQYDKEYFSHWVDVDNNSGYLCYKNQADITEKKIQCWASEGSTVTVAGKSETLDLSKAVVLTITKGDISSQLTVKTITLAPNTENMLPNGDFSMGMHFYQFGDFDLGAIGSTYKVSDGVFQVTKKYATEQHWSSKLIYSGPPLIELKRGQYYSFSFDAWASEPTNISYKFGEFGRDLNGNGLIWDNYCGKYLELSVEKKTYTTTFRQPVDDDYVDFAIEVGASDKTIYIDNIVLKEIGEPSVSK